MKLFIDSAKLHEIKLAKEIGCSGCTTNPSLIKEAIDELRKKGQNVSMEDYIKDICKVMGEGSPVSLEVMSLDSEKMIQEAKVLWEKFNPIAKNVVVKIPVSTSVEMDNVNLDGIKAISNLEKLDIKTNATLVMKPEQALLASNASYISPFVGRIDDYLRNKANMPFNKSDYFPAEGVEKNGEKINDNGIVSGVDLVRKIVGIFKGYGLKSQIIAASIRNSRQIVEIAGTGAPIATVPLYAILEMTKHPKTVEGVKKFSDDLVEEYKGIFS